MAYLASTPSQLLCLRLPPPSSLPPFVLTALHLAAAAADRESVTLLLSAGASPSIVNSCGLSPGACFLHGPDAVGAAGHATHVREIRRTLREHRERFGHVRRLADTSTKRVAVEAVGDRATAAVHRFVEFALKVPRGVFVFAHVIMSCTT